MPPALLSGKHSQVHLDSGSQISHSSQPQPTSPSSPVRWDRLLDAACLARSKSRPLHVMVCTGSASSASICDVATSGSYRTPSLQFSWAFIWMFLLAQTFPCFGLPLLVFFSFADVYLLTVEFCLISEVLSQGSLWTQQGLFDRSRSVSQHSRSGRSSAHSSRGTR